MKFLFKASYDDDIKLLKHSGYWRAAVFWALFSLALPVLILALGGTPSDLIKPIHILVLAICASGLMVLTGFTGIVSLGQGVFFLLGAYIFHSLLKAGLPWYGAFVLTPLVSGFLGYLIARPTLRMSSLILAIFTLLLMLFTEQAMKYWFYLGGGNGFQVPRLVAPGNWFAHALMWGAEQTGYLDGLEPRERRIFARSASTFALYYGALFSLFVLIWVMNNLMRSSFGRILIAIRDSEVSARSMGVNIEHYKSLAFALAGSIGALAGIFFSYEGNWFAPENVNIVLSITLLLIVVLGGLGSIHGAIIGSVAYVVLRLMLFPELTEYFNNWASESGGAIVKALAWFFNIGGLGDILFAVLVLLVLFTEPLGLYARWRKTEAFFQTFPFYRAGTFKRQRSYSKTERLK